MSKRIGSFRLATFLALATTSAALGCAAAPPPPPAPTQAAPPPSASVVTPPPAAQPVTISVIGTSDLHGRLDRLPVLAGFLANLRRARAAHGGVVLVDAGDMFQGTLESNLAEGAPVVQAYNTLGYAAAAIGNHEFDYGPVGPASTPRGPSDDPRGALAARARDAKFPFLTANIVTAADDKPLALPGGAASTVLDVAGVRVGVIGVSSIETLRTTAGPNVKDLKMDPIVPAIEREAAKLRGQEHASVVIVAAHAGGACERFDNPRDLSSCDNGEILRVAKELPEGTVNVIVAGHTHHAIAHEVHGIAVIESWAQGTAFGRVDLTVDPASGRVLSEDIKAPHALCTSTENAPTVPCDPGAYEGAPVVPDAALAAEIRPAIEQATAERDRKLGVIVDDRFTRRHDGESALGDLLTDLMREARPGTDVALMNGGGIRADLPAGPLAYGAVYEVFPFDNRFARTRMKASVLKKILAANATSGGSYLSFSGVRVIGRCTPAGLQIDLLRDNGKRIGDNEMLTVLASDFLATGGDGIFSKAGVEPSAFEIENDPPIREALVQVLSKRGGHLRPDDFLQPRKPREVLPGPRPVVCPTPSR